MRTRSKYGAVFVVGFGIMLGTLGCVPSANTAPPPVSASSTPTEPAASATPSSIPVTPSDQPVTPTEAVQFAPTAPPFESNCGMGVAKLPTTAPRFADYAATILATLKAHSSSDAIFQGLRDWGSITDTVGGVWPWDDVTGDDQADLIVIAQAPAAQFPGFDNGPEGQSLLPGDLYIFNCSPGPTFNLVYADYSTVDRITPRLVTVGDINADKLDEVAYTTSNCGVNTCYYQLHVIEWDAQSQKMKDIFPETHMPNGKQDIKDLDGDGVSEIIQHIGMQGSAGAGVQRTFDETYAWDGSQYLLKTRVVTSPQYPIHYLNDADAAIETGDYPTGISLYLTMLNDPKSLTFKGPEEIPALKAYARYRLMLAYAASGDMAKATTTHDELASEFGSKPADAPGAGFAQFASLFWDAYKKSGSLKSGCQPVIALAQADSTRWDILNDFGYANRFYKPEDMCPFGQ
jgi:hypothetical protein